MTKPLFNTIINLMLVTIKINTIGVNMVDIKIYLIPHFMVLCQIFT